MDQPRTYHESSRAVYVVYNPDGSCSLLDANGVALPTGIPRTISFASYWTDEKGEANRLRDTEAASRAPPAASATEDKD